MILAFDTYYFDDKAKTVCLAFNDWGDWQNFVVYKETRDNIADYTPGEFYKRELPCILSLLTQIDLTAVEVIVVDGYVFLDDDAKLGLGGYLYAALDDKISVIGIAKSNFKTIERLKQPLLRGDSGNPLFITAIGIDLKTATDNIARMHGPFRFPTLLKLLDQMTKEA
jgi:deoxyribonuclease V